MRGRPRWLRWMLLSGALAALAALPAMAGGRAGGAAEPPPAPPLVVTVRYGDSLWTIAREHGDPARDVREIVYEIRRANRLDSADLRAGTQLRLPAECLALQTAPPAE